MKPEIVLILHNLRSAYNVGAIFRTAEAAGVSKIYLTGYTPPPLDRFGRANKEIAKTALGAEKLVSWEAAKNFVNLAKTLKANSYKLVALEQSKNSIDYKTLGGASLTPSVRGAVILGNEVRGLSKEILDHCDIIAEIPLHGQKESLNVAVATGIFLFHLIST